MKIIFILAILGFTAVLYRGRIAYFFANQWDKVNAAKEEEEMFSLLLEKYEKFETEVLMELLQCKMPDFEKKAIQMVLQKRETTILGS